LDELLGQQSGLEARIAELVAPALDGMGYALVRVAVLGRERPTVQIMAEKTGGEAIGINDCEAISGALGAVLDVANPIPGTWTLEVSSAGIDRPLTRRGDWERFAGHIARVELAEPVEGRKRVTATIMGAGTDAALLRLENGETLAIPFTLMRRARLVLTEALIAAAAPQTARH
jgi:ribosome maturation factor RimP